MNPENKTSRLYRYNQYLFAFLGTALIVLVLAGILTAIFSISKINNKDKKTDIVLSESQKNTDYKLKISLDDIYPLSQNNNLYIIPVGRVASKANLNENRSSYESYSYYSPLNNLMIYDSNTKQIQLIFNYKISIKTYMVKKVKEDIYIIVLGANKDTNANNKLGSEDLQKLFIYHIRSKTLQTVQLKDTSFVSTKSLYKEKKDNDLTPIVFVSGGKDSNKNGSYDYKSEPEILYELNVQTSKLRKIVPQKLFQKAEKIIQQ